MAVAAIAAGIGNNIDNLQVMRDHDDHHLGKQLCSRRARLTHSSSSSSSNRIKPPPQPDQG